MHKLDLEKIASLISIVLSAIATIIATLKKGKSTITIEEIQAKEEARKEKRIAKAMKKNKIKVDASTKSEDSQTTGQASTTAIQNTQQVDQSFWNN